MEKIGIIGTGYVGLVTGVCLTQEGHGVIFNDHKKEMLANLKKGILPIHEKDLPELMKAGLKKGLIDVSTDKKYVADQSDILMFCVQTPSKEDGNADLSYLRQAVKEVAQSMKSPKILINKSTAPVGTARLIREIVRHFYNGQFDVVSVPEFLQEGKAVETFIHADRQVVGFEDDVSDEVKNRIVNLFKPFGKEIVVTNTKTAEFSKYVCNAFLALEISYINSMTGVSEKLGIDIQDISRIMRLDKRIGPKAFLEPGPGYGGMCFPKDVVSVVGIADRFGYTHKLLQVVNEINWRQRLNVAEKIHHFVQKIDKPKISILGLSFKKNTSDVRNSQSKTVIEELLKLGYKNIAVYDPLANDNFKQFNLPIEYKNSWSEAVDGSDCLVIMTEWDEFKQLDLDLVKKKMRTLNIVDSRNLLDKELAKKLGFNYMGMGRK